MYLQVYISAIVRCLFFGGGNKAKRASLASIRLIFSTRTKRKERLIFLLEFVSEVLIYGSSLSCRHYMLVVFVLVLGAV